MTRIEEIYHKLKQAWMKGDKKAIRYWEAQRDKLFKACTGYAPPKDTKLT